MPTVLASRSQVWKVHESWGWSPSLVFIASSCPRCLQENWKELLTILSGLWPSCFLCVYLSPAVELYLGQERTAACVVREAVIYHFPQMTDSEHIYAYFNVVYLYCRPHFQQLCQKYTCTVCLTGFHIWRSKGPAKWNSWVPTLGVA